MTYGLDKAQISAARSSFASFDKDGDDLIGFDELERCLRTLQINPTAEEAEAMVEDAKQASNSSGLSFPTFLYIYARAQRHVNPIEELIKAFRILEPKGCPPGHLPVETVKDILRNTRQSYTEKQINDILDHSEIVNGYVQYESLARVLIVD